MLDYAAMLIVYYGFRCARYKFFFAIVRQLACSYLTTVGGNTHVFCIITKKLYARGGGYSCVSMLSIVQLCHVFYNVLLANTLSRVCILQSKHCRMLCIDLLPVIITCRFISGDEISCSCTSVS